MPSATDLLAVLGDTELDTSRKLQCLADEYERAKGYLTNIQSADNAIGTLVRLEQAHTRWEREPENTGAAIVWAKETARLIGQLRAFLPDSSPGFISEYFEGLFTAVPIYVDQVTAVLEAHVRDIDTAVASDGTIDFTLSGTKASCSSGHVNQSGVELIRSLGVDGTTQMRLFRSACHAGMRSALRRHGYLK